MTTQDNIATTREFSTWLLHAVPMPPGSRELSHAPTPYLRRASVGFGYSNPELDRTTWWTVSRTSDSLGCWLRSHALPGLSGDSGSTLSEGVHEHDEEFTAPSTAAHTIGTLRFAYTSQADGLAVRVDVAVDARYAHTALAPRDPTSVTIRRTERFPRPGVRQHTTVRTVTAPADVARLVALVDGLPGGPLIPVTHSCPIDVAETGYALTFVAPGGSYVAHQSNGSCVPAVTLMRDGTRAGPVLDPGQRFTELADRYLGQRISPAPA